MVYKVDYCNSNTTNGDKDPATREIKNRIEVGRALLAIGNHTNKYCGNFLLVTIGSSTAGQQIRQTDRHTPYKINRRPQE